MVYINPKGRDWSAVVNFDAVGKIYVAIAVAWTVILYAGITWLILNRNLYFLRMRSIWLGIVSTSFLHLYLVKILLAYTTNGHFSCGAEFWIMSIYLPFGIALFQANMVQLHSISDRQKKLLQDQAFLAQEAVPLRLPQRGMRGLWMKWCALTPARRTEILIGVGMVVQFIVTLAIYLADRKFHSSWGSIGPSQGHLPNTKWAAKCRKGWEWIPSTVWQFVWSWFYGPYILYQIRNINDVHYWRLQITLCVIAGLPGTPIWLASLYSTQFKQVNKHWVPPMWLAPGIIMMQAATVFFPIFEAYRSRARLRSTLAAVKSWEEKRKSSESSTGYSDSTKHASTVSWKRPTSTTTSVSTRRREMYTMAALEKALAVNATPLLHFAATKEFTGENIVFLMQVHDWRAAWNRAVRDFGTITGQVKYHLFNIGVEIFATSVHTKTASFPVNVESKVRSQLEAVFGASVIGIKQHDDHVVDPFNHDAVGGIGLESPKAVLPKSEYDVPEPRYSDSIYTASDSQENFVLGTKPDLGVIPEAPETAADIPAGFGENVFDEAEASVKYMVITNTWPKFVDSSKEHDDIISTRMS